MRQLKISKSITNRSTNSLYQYLQDISKEELISPEDEVVLAQRIKNGDKDALDKLVKSNMRFVVSVAKQYQNQGLSLQDLINEGNIGLIKAAQRFDETRGFKFISFAVWWIRQSILQAIADKSRIVRLPLHQVGMLNKVKKERAKLEQLYERTPSEEEVANSLGMELEKLHETVSAGNRIVSVDAPIGEDEETNLIDILRPEEENSPDDSVMQESLHKDLQDALSTLSLLERKVIFQYFGIGYTHNKTLEEIANNENITKERARKIKERALNHLRKSESAKKLTKYLCQ
ncbi:MAG: RNA polymerase sigma factor RpoD/SigA [Bacteroidales bacterium]|nr:RNA polymerase sigma factor RpoD/SigA [Bacteroidales bacterium]MBQ9311958.1 RNA polymerase sigma factor RpoD/SigA [Bacteroidales bacterium]